MPEKKLVGMVSHFFDKIGVAVIEVKAEMKVGDRISIEGKSEPFEQKISSMQINKVSVPSAKPGQSIGMKTEKPAKPGDKVFKLL